MGIQVPVHSTAVGWASGQGKRKCVSIGLSATVPGKQRGRGDAAGHAAKNAQGSPLGSLLAKEVGGKPRALAASSDNKWLESKPQPGCVRERDKAGKQTSEPTRQEAVEE